MKRLLRITALILAVLLLVGVLAWWWLTSTRGGAQWLIGQVQSRVARYRSKVSGPLLDRIDLHVEVPRQKFGRFPPGESSAAVRERVAAARAAQSARPALNARLDVAGVREHCRLDAAGDKLLDAACERLDLSARAHQRIVKVARTIADLDGSERIAGRHLAEAMGFRQLDRERQ